MFGLTSCRGREPRLAFAGAKFLGGWACAIMVGGCLFSSTPPERNDPTGPGGGNDPTTAIVRGLVLLGEPGDYHPRPGWGVQAVWYRVVGAQQDVLYRDVVQSNLSGVYEARFQDTHKRVTRVVLRPLLCSYDPNDPRFECCADLQNPCGPCPEVWGAETIQAISAGVARDGVNLTVVCVPTAAAGP